MLPKVNRPIKKDVEEIFKDGFFVASPNLTLKFKENRLKNTKTIGFITPKTVSKKATDRNLLRRRGYKAIYPIISAFPESFLGVFIFGKKSMEIFGRKTPKQAKIDSILALNSEIRLILDKINKKK